RFAQGRFADAIRSYDEALRLDPGFEQARENLAKSRFNLANMAWREGHVDEAVREDREAIRARPEDAAYPPALGMAPLQQGRRDEAGAGVPGPAVPQPGD